MQIETILQQFDFFRGAPPGIQHEIAAASQFVTLEAGANYVCEGQHCEVIAFVGGGRLRVYKLAESGREITLYAVGPGETCLLNVTCLISRKPVPATAIVEEPVTAVAVAGDRFREWIDTVPSIRNYAFEMMATRIADVMALVEEVAFRKMDQRLVEYLGKRFFADGGHPAELEVTHERIANDLGTAREVVSRILKDLERAKVLRLARGRIALADETSLKQMIVPG